MLPKNEADLKSANAKLKFIWRASFYQAVLNALSSSPDLSEKVVPTIHSESLRLSAFARAVSYAVTGIEEWRFVFEMELEYHGEGVISATARHSPMNTQVTFSALGSEFLLGKCDGNSGVSTECRSNAVSKETLHT